MLFFGFVSGDTSGIFNEQISAPILLIFVADCTADLLRFFRYGSVRIRLRRPKTADDPKCQKYQTARDTGRPFQFIRSSFLS